MNNIVEYGKYQDFFPKKEIATNTALIDPKQVDLLKFAYNNYWMTPKFKLRWFVGQAEYTPYHILRQYLLELRSREDNLEGQEYELKKIEVQYKIAKRDYEQEKDELKKELIGVEVEKLKNGVASTQSRVKDLYIERQHFIDLVEEFLASPAGKTEDGRSLMEVMGTAEEERLEKEYWTVRLARQAAMDLCAYGRIGAGNLDAIMQLEPKQQEEALALSHTINLALEKKQEYLRVEAAKSLQIENATGKMLYIGQLDADLLNQAINQDEKITQAFAQSLNDDDKKLLAQTTQKPSDEDLNNVYSV